MPEPNGFGYDRYRRCYKRLALRGMHSQTTYFSRTFYG